MLTKIYYIFFVLLLPEFVRNIIVFCYIKIKFNAEKSLNGICQIDLLELLNWKIILNDKVLLWPNISLKWNINIGRYTYIWWNSQILANANNIKIWSFCSIATNFFAISYSTHNKTELTTSTSIPWIVYKDTGWDIIIWNDVWIGHNVSVLPNVHIWNWAIIWTWSIVTKDIPAYAIAVWNPAKVINYRFTKEKIDFIQKTNWEQLDIDSIHKVYSDFRENN